MTESTDLEVFQPSELIEAPSVLEQVTRSEVDMQVATAKRWPRSLKAFRERSLAMAVKTPEVAKSCFFVLPRGGKQIQGPSVRLAEIVCVCWGNLRCESRVTDMDDKMITATGTVWDMETNVLVRKEAKRRITDSRGKRYTDDMIVMTGNAAASVALRNAIFCVVPMAYVSPIYEHCISVAKGDRGSLDDAKKKWFSYYAQKGISTEQLLGLLRKQGIEDVDIDDISTMQGVATALNDGETTLEELFGPPAPTQNGKLSFGFKANGASRAPNGDQA